MSSNEGCSDHHQPGLEPFLWGALHDVLGKNRSTVKSLGPAVLPDYLDPLP